MKQIPKNTSTLLFVLLTGVLIVAAFISYRKVLQFNQSVDWVIHSDIVKSNISEVVSNLKDAEIGQRGYLLTTDSAFLKPYYNSRQKISVAFAALDSLATDSPTQQQHLKQFRTLTKERYFILDANMLRLKKDMPNSIINSRLLEGNNKMEEVRRQVSLMIQEEDKLLVERTHTKNRAANITPILLLLLSLFAVFVITFFFFRLQIETSRRVSVSQDNKELQVAKHQIEEREAELKQLMMQLTLATESANMGTWFLDMKTQNLQWSALHKKMWGYDEQRQNLTSEDWHIVIVDEDKEKVFDEVQQARVTGDVYETVYRIHKANDGALRCIRSVGRYYYNDKGEAESLNGVSIDITEQKNATEKIKENENQFRTFADSIQNLAWIADSEGWIYWYNKRWYDYTGTTFEEMEGGGWKKVHHPDYIEEINRLSKELREKEEAFEITFPIRRHDGEYRWFLARINPIKFTTGTIDRWIGSHTDVTEQKKINEDLQMIAKESAIKLQLKNQTFEYAEKIAKLGSYRLDTTTNLLEYSDNLFRLLGCEPQEFVPSFERYLSFVHPDDLQQVIADGEKAMQTGSVIETPYRIISKTGEVKYFRASGSITEQGDSHLIIGAVQDVSQDVLASKDLKAKNIELENTNAELASFNYIASHDLQEPLRKIQIFAKRIIDTEAGNLSEITKDYFNRINAAARRMQNLIQSLLSFSSMDLSEVIFEKTDLNQILAEVQNILNELITQKSAVIESQNLPMLRAVPIQMQQLFLNLISNSLKYSKLQVAPHIKITAEKMAISEMVGEVEQKEEFWKIVFSDNGIGFDQQYESKIFEVFQRLHGKTAYEGTGIGLAICKKIVQIHKGTIAASGELGVGATFTFLLSTNLGA